MAIDPAARQTIESLLDQNRVVLFMKGNPQAPMCGFSATAVGIVGSLVPEFAHFDVLSDEGVRQGIKEFGNWPTIPQLYVDKELVGGSDIIANMANNGELHELLGLEKPDLTPPELTITDAAAKQIRVSLEENPQAHLHFRVDGNFQSQFTLEATRGAVVAESNGITVHLDAMSAQRANGTVIDWVDSLQGSGLAISNPNAPPPVQALSVRELSERLREGPEVTLVDVRPAAERSRVPFPGATELDADSLKSLEALPKETPLAFVCHHGNASQGVADHFRKKGFTDVYNVTGGIDAWSQEVDPEVPRY